jgi:hypothetical protein
MGMGGYSMTEFDLMNLINQYSLLGLPFLLLVLGSLLGRFIVWSNA